MLRIAKILFLTCVSSVALAALCVSIHELYWGYAYELNLSTSTAFNALWRMFTFYRNPGLLYDAFRHQCLLRGLLLLGSGLAAFAVVFLASGTAVAPSERVFVVRIVCSALWAMGDGERTIQLLKQTHSDSPLEPEGSSAFNFFQAIFILIALGFSTLMATSWLLNNLRYDGRSNFSPLLMQTRKCFGSANS